VQLITKLSPCPILTQGLVVELHVVFGEVAFRSEVVLVRFPGVEVLVPFPGLIVTLELFEPFGGVVIAVAFIALVPLLVALVVELLV
jgi:hypothetical protein